MLPVIVVSEHPGRRNVRTGGFISVYSFGVQSATEGKSESGSLKQVVICVNGQEEEHKKRPCSVQLDLSFCPVQNRSCAKGAALPSFMVGFPYLS